MPKPRDVSVVVRLTRDQRRAIEAAAAATGLPPSTWMREVALQAAGATELAKHLRKAKAAGLPSRSS